MTKRWRQLTPACGALLQTMCDLLQDWGAFLDIGLYQEALVHFFGGASVVAQAVGLVRGNVALGSQQLLIYSPGLAFRLTAFTETQAYAESHLMRLLALTNLRLSNGSTSITPKSNLQPFFETLTHDCPTNPNQNVFIPLTTFP